MSAHAATVPAGLPSKECITAEVAPTTSACGSNGKFRNQRQLYGGIRRICQLTLKHGACILIWKFDVDEFDIQRPCLRSGTNCIQDQFSMEFRMKVKPDFRNAEPFLTSAISPPCLFIDLSAVVRNIHIFFRPVRSLCIESSAARVDVG